MKMIVTLLLTLVCGFSVRANGGGAASDLAAALVKASGAPGGLCLVVGMKDMALAQALAGSTGASPSSGGSWYVQVLQPDAKVAADWGTVVAGSAMRESMGIRTAGVVADDYGVDLFNLIVVEDGSLKLRAADWNRILVPNGCVFFKTAPEGFAADAKALGMVNVMAQCGQGDSYTGYRKAVTPVEWKPCDSLKWRAGARAQYCQGYAEIAFSNGLYSFQERMEVPGDIKKTRAQKVVRDAYNGRSISIGELTEKEPNWSGPKVSASIPGRKLVSHDNKSHWAGGCYSAMDLGSFILMHHNIWENKATKERVFPYITHPACFIGPIPSDMTHLVYNLPSRKNSAVSGMSAIGPAERPFDHEVGGKIHCKVAMPPEAVETTERDWPMYRGGPARGNFAVTDVGGKPVKVWETMLGTGGRDYSILSAQRTGLTQPVIGYGLVVVADMDAQRVVALDAADGKVKWVFPVGSRVSFSPTLYKGLCLIAAKDGWVYGVDAKKGTLVWKLLVAPREYYIGGNDKIESLWPTDGDVMVLDGVGYACAGFGFAIFGGVRTVAFKPETGEVVWSQCYSAPLTQNDRQANSSIWRQTSNKGEVALGAVAVNAATGVLITKGLSKKGAYIISDDYLSFGNSLSRNSEDRLHNAIQDSRLAGRMIASSPDMTVAFVIGKDSKVGRRDYGGELSLVAAKESKKEAWRMSPIELVVDDIVMTPSLVYAVGHYERIKKEPELWVISGADGKVLNTVTVDGFPAFNGMSAAGGKLYVATREGKLICYGEKKTN